MKKISSTIISRSFILILMVFLSSILLIVSACDSSTSPKTGTLIGRIVLMNDTGNPGIDALDYGGIRVRLYSSVELDSTLLRLNAEYPNIGVQISQQTEFNYRNESPIAIVQTNEEGIFEFTGISTGKYNLVVDNDLWGIRILYNIDLGGGRSSTVDMGDITIYPLVELQNSIVTPFVFESDHCYDVLNDVYVNESCIIEGGAIIRLNSNTKLVFVNTVSTVGEDCIQLFSLEDSTESTIYQWDALEIQSSDNDISRVVIHDANTGFIICGQNNQISDSIIQNSNSGFHVTGMGTSIIKNLIRDIEDRAFSMESSTGQETISFFFEKNIIQNAAYGIRTMGNATRIMDNYFIRNGTAIVSNLNLHEIQHNAFDNNNVAIVCAGSTINISNNNFYKGNNNCIAFSYEYYSSISNPVIKQNNFYKNNGSIISLYPLTTISDIDARNNYWAGSDIESQIWDSNDTEILTHQVIYNPRLNAPTLNAGIRD